MSISATVFLGSAGFLGFQWWVRLLSANLPVLAQPLHWVAKNLLPSVSGLTWMLLVLPARKEMVCCSVSAWWLFAGALSPSTPSVWFRSDLVSSDISMP